MKVLVDTHVLLWWLAGHERLGLANRAIIENKSNEVLVSVVSLWELVIKTRVGKVDVDMAQVEKAVVTLGFHKLSISPDHVAGLSDLPIFHRDPFDHMLIAQTIAESATLMSADGIMVRYPIELIQV